MELYARSAPGAFREEDALVLQERFDARDLPAFVLTRLQPALLRKQHKVSYYPTTKRWWVRSTRRATTNTGRCSTGAATSTPSLRENARPGSIRSPSWRRTRRTSPSLRPGSARYGAGTASARRWQERPSERSTRAKRSWKPSPSRCTRRRTTARPARQLLKREEVPQEMNAGSWKRRARQLTAQTYALYLAYRHPKTPW